MKLKYTLIIATVVLLTFITSTALANPGQNNACDGCHAYPPQLINITTDIKSIIVSPNEPFIININWSGGNPSGVTEINWPTNFANIAITRHNTLFNPNPRIPASVSNTPSGTTNSTSTAPQTPGTYTVRVYASGGSNATLGKETDFEDITVIVQASYNVSLSVDPKSKTTSPGVNATYRLNIRNTGSIKDNYTLVVSNPDGAAVGLDNTRIQNLAAGANANVLLNVTNASAGTFRVNVTAKSTGDPNMTASVNTLTTVGVMRIGGASQIISYSPGTSFVNDKVGDQRTFNIKLNTTANVTWYIYDVYGLDLLKVEVFSQSGVTESSYKNTSSASGIWIVKAIASNQNGTDLNTWVWFVSQKHPRNDNETHVRIEPSTLNLASKGKFTAFINLAEGYDAAVINISTVECEGAHALKGEVKKKGKELQVKFNTQDLVNVSTGNAVRLTVTGIFNDGVTLFEGSDVIRVINNSKDNKYEEDKENESEDNNKNEDIGEDEADNQKGEHSDKMNSDSMGQGKKKDSNKVNSDNKGQGKKTGSDKVNSDSKGKKVKDHHKGDEGED